MAGVLIEFANRTVSQEMELAEAIPYSFKFDVQAICNGEEIIKYGETIGLATQDINRV